MNLMDGENLMDEARGAATTGKAQRAARRQQAQADGRCTARAKGTGKRCKNHPVPGRATCMRHGGTGGRPIIHGRYSEIPERLRAAYIASLNHPRLLDLGEGIAVLDAMVVQQMRRIGDGDSPSFRRRALELVDQMRASPGNRAEVFKLLVAHLRAGAAEDRSEDALWHRLERIAVRKEEATRIGLSRQTSINAEHLVETLQRMLAELKRVSEALAARVQAGELQPSDLASKLADELATFLGVPDQRIEALEAAKRN